MSCSRTNCGGRVFLDDEFNELFCLRCGHRVSKIGRDVSDSMKRNERLKNGLS